MMKECIEREAVVTTIKTFWGCNLRNVLAALDEIPAADVQQARHGKWTLNKDGSATCSECHRTQQGAWDLDNWDNFCHFCGADMR